MLHCYQSLKKKIQNVPLAKQLIFAITLLMFCLLTAVIGFTYRRTIQVINQQQAASNLETLDLKRSNFENYFSQLQDYSMLLRNNTRLYGIFSSDKPLDYVDTTYINSALRDTFYSRNDIVSYKLYILNSKTCYSITKADFNIRYSTFGSTAEINGFGTTESAKNYLYYRPEESGSGRLMTISRVFINIINRHPLAFVEITVDDSFLRNLSGGGSGMSSVLGMLDQNNTLYYSGDGGVLNRSSLSQIAPGFGAGAGNGNFSVELGDEDYLTVHSDSQDGRWRFLSLIPQDVLQKPVEQTRNLSLILALATFFISVGIIFVMIEIQLRPLQTLARRMQSVGRGDFKTRVDIGGNAEVNNLSRQFNLMTAQVDELIQKNYIADLNEKTARLKALEAQIDPHFLYNTLQAISTEAVLSGQDTIRKMVEALASMLRYSVQEKNLVPVKTEMKHVQEYLFLQSARFEDRLAYGIRVDPASETRLIPKISIQTLVENSIKHGLESSSEQIRIAIDVLVADRELRISVADDGRGMTPERLAEVRSMTEPDKADGSGIGLTNLAARLKLLYDGRASLFVSSELGSGTKVEMTIPLPKEGDSDLPVSDH